VTKVARRRSTPGSRVAGRRRHRRSAGLRTASTARLRSRTPSVAASAATAIPAHASSSTPPCSGPAGGGASGSAAGDRPGGRAGPPWGGRGTLGFGCAGDGDCLLAAFGVAAAGPPASPRRGLRTPGRLGGRLPNTPPCSSASSGASGLGGICSWSAIQRVFHRARRTHVPTPELRNSGPSSVFLGEHPALGPASACARISAASRFFPLTTAETLDFRKYSGYDSDRRLRVLGLGMDVPAGAARVGARSAFLSQCGALRRSAGRARLPE